MQASPLQQIIDRFGDKNETNKTEARKDAKEELVKAVRNFIKKGDLLEDEFSEKGIERVSNRKLLKLLDLAETVQEEFGSRAALIDKLLELESKTTDSGYREHLEKLGLPTLYSRHEAARKRSS
jgi:hypothetical protein